MSNTASQVALNTANKLTGDVKTGRPKSINVATTTNSNKTFSLPFLHHAVLRQDGLSGSVDATKGETGLFGGSIDGTVVYGEDKPPKAFSPIPDFLLKGYNLQQTEFSTPRRVGPK